VSERATSVSASRTAVLLPTDSVIGVGVAAANAPSIRRTAVNALWRCGFTPRVASETGDLQLLLSEVSAYIDVLSHPPSSRAEQALRGALSRHLPVFLFVNTALSDSYQHFGEIIPFTTPDELGALIVERLAALQPLPDPSAPLNLHAPYTDHVPALPAPYLAHPHYLMRRLVGRERELEALRAWLGNAKPVLLLTGEMGIGKSALIWHWLLEERLNAPMQPLMLWDFAESNGSFANFVRHALAYFGNISLERVDSLPRPERLPMLLQRLAEQSAMLVLENAHYLLSAYDSVLPMHTAALSESAPATAEIETFLSALPTFSALKTLLVSRLTPQGYQAVAGVQLMTLDDLSAAEAQQLLSQLVLQGNAEMLERCAATLGQHPLALCLAAEHGNTQREGFSAWWQVHSAQFERAQSPQERLERLVESALSQTSSDARALLHYLAVQRFPVPHSMLLRHVAFYVEPPRPVEKPLYGQPNYEEAQRAWERYQRALANYPSQRAALQARLHTALSDLERRGLLLWDRATNRYTLPQAIRLSLQAIGSKEERESALSAARRVYEPLAVELPEILLDESDLRALIELYVLRLSSGQSESAAVFYRERLSKLLLTRLADPQVVLRLLRPLFPNGVHEPPALESVKERAYLGHEMALALATLGRQSEARHLLEQVLPLFVAADEPNWLCTALINYGGLIETERALRVRVFELARKLATAIGDVENRAVANFVLLRSYIEIGQWAAATEAYEAFSTSPSRYRTVARQAAAERLVAQMLLEQGQDPSGLLNSAWELAVQSNATAEKRAIHALWGETALSLMDRPDAAERFFEETLRMADDSPALIAYYRGGLARAYALQGRRDEALALLERGVPPLAAAHVYVTLGETAQAEQAALEAYRQAWGEGTPFSRWWELEQARAVLRQLRLPPPELPPYQPENFPPLPHERDLRTYILSLERGTRA